MEARSTVVFSFSVALFLCTVPCFAQSYRTENFVVHASNPAYAKKVGEAAERFRKDLSMMWLGRELPRWHHPCPIQVKFTRLAEGRTSFTFQIPPGGKGVPGNWDMMVAGPHDRILDAVLPHEITHTIFATHFGRPLPRWADEGACTTVEHVTEREKNHRMLVEFLTTGRGIPFNQMFAMTEYPRDILPLYAQGYSLARFLIERKGHRGFINFLQEGMDTGNWNLVTRKHYEIADLNELQAKWNRWVYDGCPKPTRSTQVVQQPQPSVRDIPASAIRKSRGSLQQYELNGGLAKRNTSATSWYARQKNGNARPRQIQIANSTVPMKASPSYDQSLRQYLPGSTQRFSFAVPKKNHSSQKTSRTISNPSPSNVICEDGICKIKR